MKKSDAIKPFGTAYRLAKTLGITPAAVYRWSDPIPELRAYQIREILSKGGNDDVKKNPAQDKNAQ